MAYSDQLLDEGTHLWGAQKEHPFVQALAERNLLDYASLFGLTVAGNPGVHDAMCEAFSTSSRLEYQSLEMATTREEWPIGEGRSDAGTDAGGA